MDEYFHDGVKENSMHSEMVENGLSMRIYDIFKKKLKDKAANNF